MYKSFLVINHIIKGACSEILENEFSLNLHWERYAWSLFKPIHHSWWKNGKFLSPLKVIEHNVYVIYCFIKMMETMLSNLREGFSLIFPEVHWVCAWNFTHTAVYIWLNFWYQNLKKKKKKKKGWGDEAVDRNKHL